MAYRDRSIPRPPRPVFVYETKRTAFLYVMCCETGRIKVGFSVDVEKRRRVLQAQTGRVLTVYAVAPVDAQQPRVAEAHAHAMLDQYRIRGEWFDCHPEVGVAAILRAAFEAEDG